MFLSTIFVRAIFIERRVARVEIFTVKIILRYAESIGKTVRVKYLLASYRHRVSTKIMTVKATNVNKIVARIEKSILNL